MGIKVEMSRCLSAEENRGEGRKRSMFVGRVRAACTDLKVVMWPRMLGHLMARELSRWQRAWKPVPWIPSGYSEGS